MQQLISDLNVLGLSKGDAVIVHSSLSAPGYARGRAETILDVLSADEYRVGAVPKGTVSLFDTRIVMENTKNDPRLMDGRNA